MGSMYSGMDVSEAHKLKGLEEENAKFKWMLADAMLDIGSRPAATGDACRDGVQVSPRLGPSRTPHRRRVSV
jgi:hypothetical protein